MRRSNQTDYLLLAAYVETFSKRECDFHVNGPYPSVRVETDASMLDTLYRMIPAKFPPLYERLILQYRWPKEVDLRKYRLLANPPGPTLDGLAQEMRKDTGLWDALIPDGYIQFAKGPGLNYDPVCFDIRNHQKKGDYRIVQIDHEEILCNFRIKEVMEIAANFRELIETTIKQFA
jgi:hypothetical protein